MRILLVDPPGKNKGLNTGLGYLCALLKQNHDVKVLDLNNIKIGLCGDPNPDMPIQELEEKIIGAVNEFDPELFGVSVKTFTAEISKYIFKFIKAQRPKMPTIVGGPHITLDGTRFIRENRIDFGIHGEAEYSILKVCEALEKNKSMEDVEGVFYWRNDQLVQNQKSKSIMDLDALPFPFFDNFTSVQAHGGSLKEYPLLTSRGCPYHCSYCSMPQIMGSKWRYHTPLRVIEELRYAKQKYHATSFTVIDDNFTLNLRRVDNICDLLISENLNLTWNSQNGIRADRINENLAKKMKRSGCRYVWIGIETADEKVFKAINKGEELTNIGRGIIYLKNAGIRVGGFFIVGLPYSTRETDLKSVDFAKGHGISGWWFNFVPYPHTDAWKWVQIHGRVLRPIEGALQYGANKIEPVFDTEEYPKDMRMKTYDEIHVRMRCFDRLVNPSLKQWDKWRRVFRKVAQYGLGSIFSLLIFMLKYNARIAFRKVRTQSFRFYI